MILQKTLKSIQLHLHCLSHALENLGIKKRAVTAGAWTRSRAKLKHSAFIELNETILLEQFYQESSQVERFKGKRLLAIDGSVIALPSSQSIFEEFGEEKVTNQKEGYSRSYAQAQCSVLYDLLNHLSLKAELGAYRTSELFQASKLFESLDCKGDVIIADRGYASAPFMFCVLNAGADFVVRLPTKSFKQSQRLFESKDAGLSVLCDLVVRANTLGLRKGQRIKARLINIDIAQTAQREVLATSLLDESDFPVYLFEWLYHQRWGIETYYHQLKNRLDLENFSGLSAESIYQDFYAMLFISNFETVLTRPAQITLNSKTQTDRLPKAINHSVSYHLIKEYALDLFFSNIGETAIVEKLTELFQMNPHCLRARSPTPHNNTSPMASAKYRKQIRKITF